MISLSQAINRVKPSPTQAASARAQELKALGKDILSFTVGEPDFGTPEHIKNAAIAALKDGHTRYTVPAGILLLRETICEKFRRDHGIEFSPTQIVVTNGGKHALATALTVVLDPEDEVIIPAPYWTSYPDMAALVGAKPVIVPTTAEDGYVPSADAIAQAITDKTKAIIINSPSNPSGACFSEDKMKEIGKAIKSAPNGSQILVISDEVYEYLTYDGFEHMSFMQAVPDMQNQTLIVNAFSKAYAMTGWRVGYAAGPEHIIKAMAKHQSQFTSNVCSIAQYAASKAFDDGLAFPQMMLQEFTKRREFVCEAVQQMKGITLPVKPLGAFYVFLRLEELFGKKIGSRVISCGTDFAEYLLEDYDVVVVAGEAFGDSGGIRLSFAASMENLERGMSRLHKAAASLT